MCKVKILFLPALNCKIFRNVCGGGELELRGDFFTNYTIELVALVTFNALSFVLKKTICLLVLIVTNLQMSKFQKN